MPEASWLSHNHITIRLSWVKAGQMGKLAHRPVALRSGFLGTDEYLACPLASAALPGGPAASPPGTGPWTCRTHMTEAQPDQAVPTTSRALQGSGVSLVHEFRFEPQQQLLLMNKPEPVHHEAIL